MLFKESFHVTAIVKECDSSRELHQNLTDGEVVRRKIRLDRRTKYWMGRSETELSSASCHRQKKRTQNKMY